MNFKFSYRDRSGKLIEDFAEAESRSALFSDLKKKGIVPVNVIEGAKPSAKSCIRSNSSARLGPAVVKGVLAGLIVVFLAVGTWLLLMRPKPPTHVQTVKTKIEKPKPVPKADNNVMPEKKTPAASTITNSTPRQTEPPLQTGNVTRVSFTRQMRTLPDGTKVPLNQPYFTNAIERAFSTLCNPGGMAIPLSAALRRFSDAQIKEILERPMIYNPDDSNAQIERCFAVQQLKDQFREYLKSGKTVKEAIAEIDKSVRQENRLMNMSRVGLAEAIRSGDPETVRKYVDDVNAELRTKGIRELTLPARFKKNNDTNNTMETNQ